MGRVCKKKGLVDERFGSGRTLSRPRQKARHRSIADSARSRAPESGGRGQNYLISRQFSISRSVSHFYIARSRPHFLEFSRFSRFSRSGNKRDRRRWGALGRRDWRGNQRGRTYLISFEWKNTGKTGNLSILLRPERVSESGMTGK